MPALAVPPTYVEVRAWDLDFESAGYGREGQQVAEGLKEIATQMNAIRKHAGAILNAAPSVANDNDECDLQRPAPSEVLHLRGRIAYVTELTPRIISDDE